MTWIVITYLQCRGYHRRRSGSSCFDDESILRTEGTTHANGVASVCVVLGDLVNTVPPMLYGLSITRAGMRFSLLRAGTPLLDVAPADTTHVSLLTLWDFLFL